MTIKNQARNDFFETLTSGLTNLAFFDQVYAIGHREGEKVGYHAATLEKAPLSENVLVAANGYTALLSVLRQAHDQAAMGKGKERHANDKPFEQQRMLSIARTMKDPAASLAYQVSKKVTEGLQFDDPARTVVELLGAINYLAGMVILVQERPVPAATDAYSAEADTTGPVDVEFVEQPAKPSCDRHSTYRPGCPGCHRLNDIPSEGTKAHLVIEEIKALSPESAALVRDFLAAATKANISPL